MDASKEVQTPGEFKCELYELSALLLEEAYVMKDPFTPDKDKFLIAGSRCSLCSRAVCVGTDWSLFYSKRFCLPCVKESLRAFPLEIQEDMDKRKPQQKSCKKSDTQHKSRRTKSDSSLAGVSPLLGDYHVTPFKEVTFTSSLLLERATRFLALGLGSDIPVQRLPRQGAALRC